MDSKTILCVHGTLGRYPGRWASSTVGHPEWKMVGQKRVVGSGSTVFKGDTADEGRPRGLAWATIQKHLVR